MDVIYFLKQFPAIWASFGLLVGGAAMFLVTKKFGPMRSDALNEVVGAYKEQVKAQIGLSQTQAEQHMLSLKMQKDHWSEELAKLEKERDVYRTTLHKERGELGTENTMLKLKVQELEMRPSVELIQTEQQSFYREMLGTMKEIGTALHAHDEGIDERMRPLQDACTQTANGMKELVSLIKSGGLKAA